MLPYKKNCKGFFLSLNSTSYKSNFFYTGIADFSSQTLLFFKKKSFWRKYKLTISASNGSCKLLSHVWDTVSKWLTRWKYPNMLQKKLQFKMFSNAVKFH